MTQLFLHIALFAISVIGVIYLHALRKAVKLIGYNNLPKSKKIALFADVFLWGSLFTSISVSLIHKYLW